LYIGLEKDRRDKKEGQGNHASEESKPRTVKTEGAASPRKRARREDARRA
jgi:hypothetical protein